MHLFRITWNTTSCECKNTLAIHGHFFKIDIFPLSIFSSRDLKVNENAPIDSFDFFPYFNLLSLMIYHGVCSFFHTFLLTHFPLLFSWQGGPITIWTSTRSSPGFWPTMTQRSSISPCLETSGTSPRSDSRRAMRSFLRKYLKSNGMLKL